MGYYIEGPTDDEPPGYMLVDELTWRASEGWPNFGDQYDAAILDKRGDTDYARCVIVNASYLQIRCIPIRPHEVPCDIRRALIGILGRRNEVGTWDKCWVG